MDKKISTDIPRIVPHPEDPREIIKGIVLKEGDVFQEGDFYASPKSSKWEAIPKSYVGADVLQSPGPHSARRYVRVVQKLPA